MELDDLKQAFARLDRRLEEQNAVNVAWSGARRATGWRSASAPSARAQTLADRGGRRDRLHRRRRLARHLDDPGGPFVSGVILHLYGIAMIIFGAVTKALIGGIDWAGPVLGIQRRLSRVRKAQVLAGIAIGLSWCVLWIPALIVLFHLLFGVDIVAPAPDDWLWMTRRRRGADGRRRPAPSLGPRDRTDGITAAFDDAFTGEHLKRAQAELDSISASSATEPKDSSS